MNITSNWQTALQQSFHDTTELLAFLQLAPAELPYTLLEAPPFRFRVTRAFATRMQKNNPYDPLLLQVLPLTAESLTPPGYSTDPLAEAEANPIPGLLHKYPSRVLLTLTGACAIHCRYCFRQHFPYADNNPGSRGWQAAIAYIQAHPEIHEVILSGGDPLVVPDAILGQLTEQLAAIPHVDTLRVHSRLPVVLPERITPTLLHWFTTTRLKPVLVYHTNHPQELDTNVLDAALRLHAAGVTLLNQSVLLKGINDDAAVLAQLSKKLFSAQILPYYLHVLDKVQGTAHFDLPEETAKNLHRALMEMLPGYLVPKLVREIAGRQSKTPVF
jgi:EF-P beta-lysylation protein EpmB